MLNVTKKNQYSLKTKRYVTTAQQNRSLYQEAVQKPTQEMFVVNIDSVDCTLK